jgi:hypothetical protein
MSEPILRLQISLEHAQTQSPDADSDSVRVA